MNIGSFNRRISICGQFLSRARMALYDEVKLNVSKMGL